MTFKDRSVSFYVVLWLGLALLLGGVLAARPAYRRYKDWRALQIVAEIRDQHLPAGDLESANRKLRLAHGYSPRLPEVLRITAEVLTRVGRPEGLEYYGMLIETGRATTQDRIDYARESLRRDRPEVARVQVRKVMQDSPLNRDGLMLGIQVLERLGLVSEATRLAQAALQAYPSDDEAVWRLGSLQVAFGETAAREAGQRLLWGLAMSSSQFGPASAGQLAMEPNLKNSELSLLAKSLESIPGRTLSQDLLSYDLRYRVSRPEDRGPIVATARQRLGPQPTPNDRILIADWLLTHQAPELVLEVITESLSRQNPAAAQRWLQAHANLGRWDQVRGLIDDSTMAIGLELRHCYRAILSSREGDTNGVAFHLGQAVTSLTDTSVMIQPVAQYAEKLGQPKLAAQAYEKLLSRPERAAAAAKEILRLLGPSDDVDLVLGSLRRLRQFRPDDEGIEDYISWYELLIRQNVAENSRRAMERTTRFPEQSRYRLTAALGKLREENPEAALALMEGQHFDRTNASPRARLLYVAALGNAGQRESAQRLAHLLNTKSFKPAELDLIRPWLDSQAP